MWWHHVKMVLSRKYRKNHWTWQRDALISSVAGSRQRSQTTRRRADELVASGATVGSGQSPEMDRLEIGLNFELVFIAQTMPKIRALRRKLRWFT